MKYRFKYLFKLNGDISSSSSLLHFIENYEIIENEIEIEFTEFIEFHKWVLIKIGNTFYKSYFSYNNYSFETLRQLLGNNLQTVNEAIIEGVIN